MLCKNFALRVAAVLVAVQTSLSGGEPVKEPKRTAIEFLDTRGGEHTHFLDRRVTPVRKYEHNPIIADGHSVQGIVKEKDGRVRMWYLTRRKIPGHKGAAREYALRYAESTDGIHWTLPNLGLKEFDGSRDNNVILTAHDVDTKGRKISYEQGIWNFCVLDRERS